MLIDDLYPITGETSYNLRPFRVHTPVGPCAAQAAGFDL